MLSISQCPAATGCQSAISTSCQRCAGITAPDRTESDGVRLSSTRSGRPTPRDQSGGSRGITGDRDALAADVAAQVSVVYKRPLQSLTDGETDEDLRERARRSQQLANRFHLAALRAERAEFLRRHARDAINDETLSRLLRETDLAESGIELRSCAGSSFH